MIFDLHTETFIILYCLIVLVSFIIYKIKKKHIYSFVFIAITECYLLFLVKVTLLPIPCYSRQYLEDFREFCGGRYKFTQLIPFRTICGMLKTNILKNITVQLCGNIVLLLPLPILVGLTREKSVLSIRKLFFLGIFVSLVIELAQLGIDCLVDYPNKVCDVDDLILNSFGVLIGIVIYCLITKIKWLYSYLRKEWVFVRSC